MRELYEDNVDPEAVLLLDAQNAFISMNRSVALLNNNIQIFCLEIATYLINTYRLPPRLIIKGDKNVSDKIKSCDGTTQGDNLGMIFLLSWNYTRLEGFERKISRE